MKNIKPPLEDPISTFKAIINSKRGQTRQDLQALLPLVIQRYNDYESNKYELSLLEEYNTFTEQQVNILIKCYEAETEELSKLKAMILSQQGIDTNSDCQYCTLGEAMTLDHYLPKSLFPEYAVLPINLVPCCYRCNNKRGSMWISESDKIRTTINLYFDDLSKGQFLYCAINYENNIPKVSFFLQKDAAISDELFKVIEAHFSILSLYDRFQKKVNTEISEITRRLCKLKANHDFEKEKLKAFLLDDVDTLAKTYGLNYWKRALRKALAESEDFFNTIL